MRQSRDDDFKDTMEGSLENTGRMKQIEVKDARICKKNAWICVGCGVGEFGCWGTYSE